MTVKCNCSDWGMTDHIPSCPKSRRAYRRRIMSQCWKCGYRPRVNVLAKIRQRGVPGNRDFRSTCIDTLACDKRKARIARGHEVLTLERKLKAMTAAKNRAVEELKKAELAPCWKCEELPCELPRWGGLRCKAQSKRLALIAELEGVK